jgi:hypothetical protein
MHETTDKSSIAQFNVVAKRYPMKDDPKLLSNLIVITPGEEEKYFYGSQGT